MSHKPFTALAWLALAAAAAPSCKTTEERADERAAEVVADIEKGASADLDPSGVTAVLTWIETGTAAQFVGWRRLPAYAVLSPDERKAIELELDEAYLATRRSSTLPAELTRAREAVALLETVSSELEGWRIPNLRRYLPGAQPRLGRLHLALFLPAPLIVTARGDVVIDALRLGDASPSETFAHATSALYTAALAKQLPEPQPVVDLETFENAFLLRLHEEGLVTYVTAQGVDFETMTDDFKASLDRRAVASKFFELEELLLGMNVATLPEEVILHQKALDELTARSHTYPIIGSYVASAIETAYGHDALVDTIRRGPRAFWKAYLETSPGALVWLRLPSEQPAEMSSEPLAGH